MNADGDAAGMSVRRFETVGSIVEIDEALLRYRRFPRYEKPRERPEWSDERAGVLQDFVWHDYLTWRFEPEYAAVVNFYGRVERVQTGWRLIVVTPVTVDGDDASGRTLVASFPMPDGYEPAAADR